MRKPKVYKTAPKTQTGAFFYTCSKDFDVYGYDFEERRKVFDKCECDFDVCRMNIETYGCRFDICSKNFEVCGYYIEEAGKVFDKCGNEL